MNSKCITKNTVIGLEGGEFLLHSEAEAIMEWFMNNHPNLYTAVQLSCSSQSHKSRTAVSSCPSVCVAGWQQRHIQNNERMQWSRQGDRGG